MLAKAHELGLTKSQAEGLFGTFNERSSAAKQQMEVEKALRFSQEDAAVKQEWGQAYVKNLAEAQAGAKVAGLDSTAIDKLSDALGHKATMELLQKIGSRTGESDFVSGDNVQGFNGSLTPGQAKAEIQSLMQDKNFVAKYLSKDAISVAKMAELHKYAYPE
jgi:hypothetical protein